MIFACLEASMHAFYSPGWLVFCKNEEAKDSVYFWCMLDFSPAIRCILITANLFAFLVFFKASKRPKYWSFRPSVIISQHIHRDTRGFGIFWFLVLHTYAAASSVLDPSFNAVCSSYQLALKTQQICKIHQRAVMNPSTVLNNFIRGARSSGDNSWRDSDLVTSEWPRKTWNGEWWYVYVSRPKKFCS